MENIESVGIGEFRANLHRYTTAGTHPIAVTSHDRLVGYYIPVAPKPSQAVFDKLREAGREIAAALLESGTTEDEIIAEFDRLRKQGRKDGQA
jgi:hypothetical protein